MARPIVDQVAAIWNEAEDATECREREIYKYTSMMVIAKESDIVMDCMIHCSIRCYFLKANEGRIKVSKKESWWGTGASFGSRKSNTSHSATAEELIATKAAVYEEYAEKGTTVSAREFYAYRFQIRESTNDTFGIRTFASTICSRHVRKD